jgi:hypothetical protein
MRTATDEPASGDPESDQALECGWLAAVLLARMAAVHGRGEEVALHAELDGADPMGNPVFRGRVLDAAAFAAGGLLLTQQLEAELALLGGVPLPAIADGTVLIAEAQLEAHLAATTPAGGGGDELRLPRPVEKVDAGRGGLPLRQTGAYTDHN